VDTLDHGLTGFSLRVCYRYRMLRTRTAALATTLAMLALPATSLAQSAGDDQYQDPLAGSGGSHGHITNTTGGGSSSSGSSSSGGAGGGSSSSSSSPSTGSNVPTAGAATNGTTTTPTTGEAASGTPKGQLPRTGFDVIVSFELGLAMLLAGLVAHRMITLRERREN
jgi:hypothetical protein